MSATVDIALNAIQPVLDELSQEEIVALAQRILHLNQCTEEAKSIFASYPIHRDKAGLIPFFMTREEETVWGQVIAAKDIDDLRAKVAAGSEFAILDDTFDSDATGPWELAHPPKSVIEKVAQMGYDTGLFYIPQPRDEDDDYDEDEDYEDDDDE